MKRTPMRNGWRPCDVTGDWSCRPKSPRSMSSACPTRRSGEGYTAENDPRAVGHRVVRGGHYRNGANFARAASRTWGVPDPDDQYDPKHGFRLVIGPPLPARSGQAFADALRWRQEHGWAGTTPPPHRAADARRATA